MLAAKGGGAEMIKPDKATIRIGIIVLLIIAFAIFLRKVPLDKYIYIRSAANIARSLIYIGLFAAWGFSLYKRIIQVQVRRYLIAIAVFMVFWMIIRTVKFNISAYAEPSFVRLCWYLFYIPLLLIPMLGVFAAVAIGKPENYRTPGRMHLLWFPTIFLALLVLTNDLHTLIFRFPPGLPWTDFDYYYAPAYIFVAAWAFGSSAFAPGLILHKCRIPHSRKVMWLPVVPFTLIIVYTVFYYFGFEWLRIILGDMTAALCVLTVASFESCIQCGMIPTNTRYNKLFAIASVAAQITDADYSLLLSSDTARNVQKETLRQTQDAPVMLPDNIRLSGSPISCGYVIWQEDVSSLKNALDELADTNEYLLGKNQLLAERYKTSRQRRRLAEQNRLYNEMRTQTADKAALLSELVYRLDSAEEDAEIKALLLRILVLGVYIKRRNNLIFLAEEQNLIPSSELRNFLEELTRSFLLCGVSCEYLDVGEHSFTVACLASLYDAPEAVLEKTAARITSLYIAVRFEREQAVTTVRLSGMEDAPELQTDGLYAEDEEGEWLFTCRVPIGDDEQ